VAGQVREARGNFDAAKAGLAAERLGVEAQVTQSQLEVQAARVAIDAARDSVTNARERLRLAEGRYESGVGSIIELEDAQLAYSSASAQLVQADYVLSSARADLLSALGK
jgi:outer membrane protein